MPSLEALKERQRKLEESKKAISAKIRAVEIKEKTGRYINVGREIERLFIDKHTGFDNADIIEIYEKYFGTLPESAPSGNPN